MYYECEEDIKRQKRNRLEGIAEAMGHVEEDEGREVIKNIFKMSRI